jgi:adenosylmethionine-8-amino-7-oxononanoate aminotransferase
MEEKPQQMPPAWYEPGSSNVWLPYVQMKTMREPLAVARTEGCRIVLNDGRELIDGVASWWTACHGYNHPHIRAALERQLSVMPHVMLAGLRMSRPIRWRGGSPRCCRAILNACSFPTPARSPSRSP